MPREANLAREMHVIAALEEPSGSQATASIYTARCLAHVLELFGIPAKEPGAESISLDPGHLRKVSADPRPMGIAKSLEGRFRSRLRHSRP